MKISLVVPGGVDRSGEYRVIPALLALIERLSARHIVHVFCLHQEREFAEWDFAGARIHNIGEGGTRMRALRAIRAEHGLWPFDLVQSIFSGASGLVAVAAGRLLGIPSVVHVAGGEPVRLPEIGYGGRLRWRSRAQEAVARKGATVLTAASAPQIEMLCRLGVKARRVPLGVSLNAWPAQEPLAHDPQEPARLIHVASLNRVKDQATLLNALAHLERMRIDFRADIVGEDTLGGTIEGLAQELGLAGKVRFHGFLTQRQLYPLMRMAHVMVLSSRHEAGPVVMLEAAVLGVPTVGTAVGHIAEWAPGAALAVPVGNAPALAGALRAVLTDEVLRLRLGHEAQVRAVREDADYTAECLEALYSELLHGGQGA